LIIKRDHKVGPRYYDDISLISSSVCELKRIFDVCECELVWLDMAINTKILSGLALEMIMSAQT